MSDEDEGPSSEDLLFARVESLCARAPFIAHLGVKLSRVGKGFVEILLPAKHEHLQQDGFVHAGVLVTLADHAAGGAALTLCAEHETVLTSSVSVFLLRPAIGSTVRCEAQVIRAGRTNTVVEANVHAGQGSSEKLVVRATVQLSRVSLPAKKQSERPPQAPT